MLILSTAFEVALILCRDTKFNNSAISVRIVQ